MSFFEPTQKELIEKASEILIAEVDSEGLIDLYSRDLISEQDLIDRLKWLKQQSELIAPIKLADELEQQRSA